MVPLNPDDWWQELEEQAEGAGLNVRWVLSRDQVEGNFAAAAAKTPPGQRRRGGTSPPQIHPGFRSAVLLGSAGGRFWEKFSAARGSLPAAETSPLDRYTELTVEGLLQSVRRRDSAAAAGYPFRHPNQIVPFLAFLGGSGLLRGVPFGVSVHPRFGPWFAWRAVILLALEEEPTPLPAESACRGCAAPCVAACPAGAVALDDFSWRSCAKFRLAEAACAETCHARQACPVGRSYRYGDPQLAFHCRASLREIRAARAQAGKT